MHDGKPADMLPVTVLIVDDERPARRKLRRMVDAAPGVARVFEAPAAQLALDVIDSEAPDVVFLDVNMPGMDGFQLLDAVGDRGDMAIVFVTAYDEHAVRAFDVRAVDYLLKPYDESRFREALERARQSVADRRASARTRPTHPSRHTARLLVQAADGSRVLLSLERVLRIEAHRNDVVLHSDGRTFRLRSTLGDLEARLDPDRFLRINRSEIVNLERIARMEPLDHGDARVHLDDGAVRRLSRRFRHRMQRFE